MQFIPSLDDRSHGCTTEYWLSNLGVTLLTLQLRWLNQAFRPRRREHSSFCRVWTNCTDSVPMLLSISLPMAGKRAVNILFPKIELHHIHAHESCDVDPPPEVTASVASLGCPPITRTVSAC